MALRRAAPSELQLNPQQHRAGEGALQLQCLDNQFKFFREMWGFIFALWQIIPDKVEEYIEEQKIHVWSSPMIEVVRAGFAMVINPNSGWRLSAERAMARNFVRPAEALHPDVVTAMDVRMPVYQTA